MLYVDETPGLGVQCSLCRRDNLESEDTVYCACGECGQLICNRCHKEKYCENCGDPMRPECYAKRPCCPKSECTEYLEELQAPEPESTPAPAVPCSVDPSHRYCDCDCPF